MSDSNPFDNTPLDVETVEVELKTGVVVQVIFPDDEVTGVYPIDFGAITDLLHLEQSLFHAIKTLPDAVWDHLKSTVLKGDAE